MNSESIRESVYNWALQQNFTAPYGVLEGCHLSKKGTKYHSVTFGHARTLDATVEIYNRNFLLLRTNTHGLEVFKNYDDLMSALNLRFGVK